MPITITHSAQVAQESDHFRLSATVTDGELSAVIVQLRDIRGDWSRPIEIFDALPTLKALYNALPPFLHDVDVAMGKTKRGEEG